MDKSALDDISASVQVNCDISDARHGSEYGLCTYLMKMREYFRWERGLGFSASLGNDEIGAWLTEREHRWHGLEASDFLPVRVDESEYDPLDAHQINEALCPHGLVYSGGIGRSGKPHFFLGELVCREERADYSLYVSGREFARDLSAPPAMTRDGVIYVRREALRQLLWEKLENWRWHRPDNPLGRAFACYDFERQLDESLERMTDHELDLVLLHEQGECRAGDWLGEGWGRMLLDLAGTPGEIATRAVRDHLADCMVTLPALADMERPSSLHFFIGSLSAMRKSLFPGLREAYDRWLQGGDRQPIRDIAQVGEQHWQSLAREMLDLHQAHGTGAAAPIVRLAESSSL